MNANANVENGNGNGGEVALEPGAGDTNGGDGTSHAVGENGGMVVDAGGSGAGNINVTGNGTGAGGIAMAADAGQNDTGKVNLVDHDGDEMMMDEDKGGVALPRAENGGGGGQVPEQQHHHPHQQRLQGEGDEEMMDQDQGQLENAAQGMMKGDLGDAGDLAITSGADGSEGFVAPPANAG